MVKVKKLAHTIHKLVHFRPRSIKLILSGMAVALRSLALFGIVLLIASQIFDYHYRNRIYPGVLVEGIDFGGQSPHAVTNYYLSKNIPFEKLIITFASQDQIATISGSDLGIGFDATLSSQHAYLIGRGAKSFFADGMTKLAALQRQINLKPLFRFKEGVLDSFLEEQAQHAYIPVEEALFSFQNGRVTAFRPSHDGRVLNKDKTKETLIASLNELAATLNPKTTITTPLIVETVNPTATTENVNTFGIKERIGSGESYFRGSIPGRIHNVALGASRVNGTLIPPNSVFSFNNAVGDISAATGYKQAYVIKEGHTVLDDGGGICQVSTTLFRAALNAGLTIIERHAHSYRVGYYEQGGWKPGFDATVYAPSYDLKIKNNTSSHILIQATADTANLKLTFELYGTGDGRQITISPARLWDSQPAPPDLYQDDPTLPPGVVKQVDFAAPGIKSAFDYMVIRNSETLTKDTFVSNFVPWQAVYLRGPTQ